MRRFALTVLGGVLAATCVQAQVKYTDAIEWMPEFSGCFWRSTDGEAFWACADERHILEPTEQSRNEIWKIDYDTGAVLATNDFSPLELNDMEAMCPDGNGGYFIATSQSLTSSLGGDANRMRLTHFESNGDEEYTFNAFRDALVAEYAWLANYTNKAAKFGGLDVEGIAYDAQSDRMWIGLRGPQVDTNAPSTSGGYAVLLTLTNVLDGSGDMNTTLTWADESPTTLDLGGEGIRDLYWDADTTNLFLLTGKQEGTESFLDNQGNTNTTTQSCHVLAYDPATEKLTFCLRVPQVPSAPDGATTTSEAEGITAITLDSQKKLLLTYDSKTHGVYQAFDFPAPSTFAESGEDEGAFGM